VVVGIGVHVREFTGEVVAKLSDPADIGRLCSFAATDPARYPLLSGVDPYDDTYFNARQASRLALELQALAERIEEAELLAAVTALLPLTFLLEVAPGRPHHRQLIFIGD
jgi:hypothetical protein